MTTLNSRRLVPIQNVAETREEEAARRSPSEAVADASALLPDGSALLDFLNMLAMVPAAAVNAAQPPGRAPSPAEPPVSTAAASTAADEDSASAALPVASPIAFTPAAAPPPPAVLMPAAAPPRLALDHPNWSQALGERLRWSVDNGLAEAIIELSPEELGPIRIRISSEGETTQVAFQASHAATRELLSFALPQLRDMFNAQGLQLGRTQVGALATPARATRTPGDEPATTLPRRRSWRLCLVDDYV
jgi:flagellar hook-length control protein FliK